MGRAGSDRGRRPGPGGKGSAPSKRRREPRERDSSGPGAGETPSGSSRLLLTRLVHDGAIWKVYVATTVQPDGRNRTVLEFENGSAGSACSRSAEGPLLDALHSGAPVSRADLLAELALALVTSAGGDAGDAGEAAAASDAPAPSDDAIAGEAVDVADAHEPDPAGLEDVAEPAS